LGKGGVGGRGGRKLALLPSPEEGGRERRSSMPCNSIKKAGVTSGKPILATDLQERARSDPQAS